MKTSSKCWAGASAGAAQAGHASTGVWARQAKGPVLGRDGARDVPEARPSATAALALERSAGRLTAPVHPVRLRRTKRSAGAGGPREPVRRGETAETGAPRRAGASRKDTGTVCGPDGCKCQPSAAKCHNLEVTSCATTSRSV